MIIDSIQNGDSGEKSQKKVAIKKLMFQRRQRQRTSKQKEYVIRSFIVLILDQIILFCSDYYNNNYLLL